MVLGVGVQKQTPARRKKRDKTHMLNRIKQFQEVLLNIPHFKIVNSHSFFNHFTEGVVKNTGSYFL